MVCVGMRPAKRGATLRPSVLPLTAILALVAGMIALFPASGGEPREIDYSRELAEATQRARYDVYAPETLGPGWRATDAQFFMHNGRARWHLGFVTPSGAQVGLDQSDGSPFPFVDLVTGGGAPVGDIMIGGQAWSKRVHEDRDLRSLVLERADSAVVISGKTDFPELVALAVWLKGPLWR